MCTISDKLKLCTCKTKDVEQLKHYWILKRHSEFGYSIMGLAIPPANIGEEADKLNEAIILNMLNEGNCFDVELQHQEDDILDLHFTFRPDKEQYFMGTEYGNYLAYAFKSKNNRWEKDDYSPFGEDLEVIQQGKIMRAFANKKL